MHSRVVVAGLYHMGSTRVPYKAGRLIEGKPLWAYSFQRVVHFVKPDNEFACIIIPLGYENDLLEHSARCLFPNAEVYRAPKYETAVPYFRWLANKLGLDDDDIIVRAYADEPFSYCEDLLYRIEALDDAKRYNMVMHAPIKFPDRDWAWAVTCGMWTWRVKLYRDPLFTLYERPGWDKWSLTHFRALFQSGNPVARPLFVCKPEPAKEPWPCQPLWVDEEEQYLVVWDIITRARQIMSETDWEQEPIPDRLIRKLFTGRMAEELGNIPRKTTKPFAEDYETWAALKTICEKDGVVMAMELLNDARFCKYDVDEE